MQDLVATVEKQTRLAIINVIVSSPSTPVGDLLALATGEHAPLMRGITLGELVDALQATSPARGRKKKTARTPATKRVIAKPAAKPAKPAKQVKSGVEPDVRTPRGRVAYDQALLHTLGELGGGPASSRELTTKVGGTTLQARAALARLITAGKITWSGKARGTRYSLAKG
jgi:hypothetical protein